jgi:hypothetical protein
MIAMLSSFTATSAILVNQGGLRGFANLANSGCFILSIFSLSLGFSLRLLISEADTDPVHAFQNNILFLIQFIAMVYSKVFILLNRKHPGNTLTTWGYSSEARRKCISCRVFILLNQKHTERKSTMDSVEPEKTDENSKS